ncbi:hypothetical protein [Bradyrhizobium frederickii]|nr:hypothetical protein [Bradyrhizobium frederickii]
MAIHDYIADSAFLLSCSPPRYVRSDGTDGCAIMPAIRPMAGGISLLTIS